MNAQIFLTNEHTLKNTNSKQNLSRFTFPVWIVYPQLWPPHGADLAVTPCGTLHLWLVYSFFGGRGSHTQERISTTYHLRIQFLTGVGTPAVKQDMNFCIWSITWRWPPQACEGGSQFTGILLAPVLRRARFRGSCRIAFKHPLGHCTGAKENNTNFWSDMLLHKSCDQCVW